MVEREYTTIYGKDFKLDDKKSYALITGNSSVIMISPSDLRGFIGRLPPDSISCLFQMIGELAGKGDGLERAGFAFTESFPYNDGSEKISWEEGERFYDRLRNTYEVLEQIVDN